MLTPSAQLKSLWEQESACCIAVGCMGFMDLRRGSPQSSEAVSFQSQVVAAGPGAIMATSR